MQNRKKRSVQDAASDQTSAKKARILALDKIELKGLLLRRDYLKKEFNNLTLSLSALIQIMVKMQETLTNSPSDVQTKANLSKLISEEHQLSNQRNANMIARGQINKRIKTLVARLEGGKAEKKSRINEIGAQIISLNNDLLSIKFVLGQKLYEQEEHQASLGHLTGALVTDFFAISRKLGCEIVSLQSQIKAKENLLLKLEEELDALQKIVSGYECLTEQSDPSPNFPLSHIANTRQLFQTPSSKVQRLPFKFSFSDYTFAELHQLIYESSTVNFAANSINKHPQVITSYLGKFLYEGQPLTFDRLKEISFETLQALLGKYYDTHLVPTRISLKEDTIAYIHEQLIHSSGIQNAATRLGTHLKTLDTFFNDHHMTYEEFKKMTIEEARQRWGDDYDKNYYGAYVIKNQRIMLEE